MISIAEYDAAEQRHRVGLSARAIEAFAPATFTAVNYPIRVVEQREIVRYVDAMHETKNALYFKPQHRFSAAEGDQLRRIGDLVASRTELHFGRRTRPWMAPFAAVQMYRVIVALTAAAGQRGDVLELGPGSGYLGALLIQAGHRYAAMDNTQAFYLWQAHLLDWMTDGAAHDFSLADDWHSGAAVSHLPWWHFAALPRDAAPRFDIIVCDHALGEMTPMALKFVLRAGRRLLRGDGAKFFVFQSSGAHHGSAPEQVRREFYRAGYRLLPASNFYAFVPEGSKFYDTALPEDLAFGTGFLAKVRRRLSRRTSWAPAVVMVGHTPGDATLAADQIVPLVAAEAPMDYEFLAAAGQVVPLFEATAGSR